MSQMVQVSQILSTYRGSERTRQKVEEQVRERWGDAEAEKFNPFTSAMTMKAWSRAGFKVKKGAKALRSTTLVEVKDEKGEVIRRYPKTVFLFHELQVEPRNSANSILSPSL